MPGLVDIEQALNYMGRFFNDLDFTQFDLDAPFPELGDYGRNGWESSTDSIKKTAREKELTLREMALQVTTGRHAFIGTPEHVADTMQDWFESGACDGFMLSGSVLPQGFNDFVDLVLPILKAKGRVPDRIRGKHAAREPGAACAGEPLHRRQAHLNAECAEAAEFLLSVFALFAHSALNRIKDAMPETLLAIHGAVTRPGRLYQAVQVALSGVEGDGSPLFDTLHLGDYRISFADGRPLSDYDDDTLEVVERVISADMCLIATPVFRASFTGALKNLLDHVPVEGLRGKACGLIGMGATDHHYLSVDTQLRPVLAWFGAHVVPGMVYLQSRHFQDGKLSDPQAIADLQSLARSVVALHRAIQEGGLSGPAPLAAR